MALKAVIFDLDDTLYDFETAHQLGLREMAEYGEARFDISAKKFIRSYHEADRQVKQQIPAVASCHNRVLIMQRMLELLGLPAIVTPLDLYEIYWGSILRSIKPRAGAVEMLETLHQNGVRICICTNMTAHIQHRKVAALGLAEYLDYIVTSEEVGVEKPDPTIFLACLKKLKVSAEETIYIGDSFRTDICGAHAAGIAPIWLNTRKQARPAVDFLYKEIFSLESML